MKNDKSIIYASIFYNSCRDLKNTSINNRLYPTTRDEHTRIREKMNVMYSVDRMKNYTTKEIGDMIFKCVHS